MIIGRSLVRPLFEERDEGHEEYLDRSASNSAKIRTTCLLNAITQHCNYKNPNFDVLLTVHPSVIILVINQIKAQNLVL